MKPYLETTISASMVRRTYGVANPMRQLLGPYRLVFFPRLWHKPTPLTQEHMWRIGKWIIVQLFMWSYCSIPSGKLVQNIAWITEYTILRPHICSCYMYIYLRCSGIICCRYVLHSGDMTENCSIVAIACITEKLHTTCNKKIMQTGYLKMQKSMCIYLFWHVSCAVE